MKRLAPVVLLILGVTGSLWAGNGKLIGTVVDASTKEPLIGANVLLVGTSLGAATDVSGKFIILSVPTGEYDLRVTYVGYQQETKSGVRVSSDLTTEVNFALNAASVEMKPIEVVAQAPLINKSATAVIRTGTQEEIANLPVRGVTSAVALQPGIVMQDERGIQKLYIRGGRSDEVGYYVEGVSTRDVVTGDNATRVIPEALEEFQVHAGGYTAEYGGANAGIVREQLRAGTPEYRATLQAETDNLTGAGFLSFHPGSKFLDTYGYGYSDYVLTLSGPVATDRVKVFVAGENQFQRDTYVRFVTPFHFTNLADLNSAQDTVRSLDYGAGNTPGTMRNRYSIDGTLTFDYNPIIVRIGGTYSWQRQQIYDQRPDVHDSPIVHIFNQSRIPLNDQGNGLVNLKLTHFLTPKTFYELNFSLYDDRAKTYDPLFGDDYLHYKDSLLLSDMGYNTNASFSENPTDYSLNSFPFDRPGKSIAMYAKEHQQYYGASADVTSQLSAHELKVGGGFQRYTIRGFSVGRRPGREDLLATIRSSPDLYRNPGTYDPLTGDYSRDIFYRDAGDFINAYGYDIYGNEINGGFDGPRHPIFSDVYLLDKLELSDLIVNAGLRLDIIDTDDRQFRDFIDVNGTYGRPGEHYSASNPLQTSSYELIPAGIEKKPAFKQVSPRLGFSFPVSDRTTFHVQYGKFLQAPQLSTLYAGRGISAVMFSGQYFVPQPIGFGLDPERTTQYEIGFTQQFSDYAAFDITGFYKDIQGQIQYAQVNTDPGSVAAAYPTLQNGDYATTKGLEFRLTLRRIARVQAQVNYTLSDAQGTGSTVYAAVSGIANATPRPTVISPLDFNQTHRGSFNLDYRFGENEGGPILSRLGANLLLTFNSGHNFTLAYGGIGQRGAYLGGILADDDPRSRKPLEAINSSTTPWFYEIDLRVDKSIRVGMLDFNIYAYIQNLLNTQNVINVYGRTGNAYDDGFLSNPDLSGPIVASRGQQFVDLYQAINLGNRQHYALTQGGDLFGPPRQVRVGLRLEY